MQEEEHVVSIITSLSNIDKDDWDQCANPPHLPYNPFVSHDFLDVLEQSGSAVTEAGWYAQHMILKDSDHGVASAVAAGCVVTQIPDLRPTGLPLPELGQRFAGDLADAVIGIGLLT